MRDNFNILITCYNRAENLEELILNVLKNTNSKVFIHQDGPKPNDTNYDEQRRVYEILKKYKSKRVLILRQKSNLGCYKAVKFAIDWAIETSEYLLILEDDLIVDKAAFSFLRNSVHILSSPSVATISLFRDTIDVRYFKNKIQASSFFSSWGWATSASHWSTFEDRINLSSFVRVIFNIWRNFGYQPTLKFSIIYKKIYYGQIDSWAYRWFFSLLAQKKITVYPTRNYIINTGFGKNATHTKINRLHNFNLQTKNNVNEFEISKLNPINIYFEKLLLQSRFGFTNSRKYPYVR